MKTNIHLTIWLILTILFLSPNPIKAQNATTKLAVERMNDYDYVKAISIYTNYFKLNTPSTEDIRNITYCYMMINDTKSAKEWASKLVNNANPEPKELLLYANLLKMESEYEQAIVQYTRYKTLVPNDPKADEMIRSCKDAMSWIQNPTSFEVANMDKLNTENADFGLIPYKDGYVFTSDRNQTNILSKNKTYGWTGNPYLKLYETKSAESGSSIDAMSDLNDKFHNGPGQYDLNRQEFFFTRTKMVRVTKKTLNNDPTSWIEKVQSSDYENRLEIQIAKNTDGKWSAIKPFQYNKPEEYSVGHPTISADGNTLYFVSDMPNGFGKTDIYSCQRNEDGSWKQPENLGNTINTSGKEMFPFIDKDGTLYFSSDGHEGMGGLDIFKSTFVNNNWGTVENLRFPINSSKDDFSIYFTQSGKSGYLSSNRYDGKGNDDIYSFNINQKSELIIAVIPKQRDENNNIVPLDGVTLKVENITENKIIQELKFINGVYTLTGKCKTTYQIAGTKDGYLTQSKTFETECKTRNDTLFVEIILEKSPKELIIAVIPKQIDKNNNIVPLDGMILKIENITENKKKEDPKFANGLFTIDGKCKTTYHITGSKQGYVAESKTIETDCTTRNDTIFVEIILEKLRMNQLIVLKNIYYDFDKSFIRNDATGDLDKVVQIMTDNPGIFVELGSHTDARGSDEYNIKLSQRRANAAVKYIISKGIYKNRITAKGYGETQHLNECSNDVECSEEAHQLNRRTEFKVTGIINGKQVQIKSEQ